MNEWGSAAGVTTFTGCHIQSLFFPGHVAMDNNNMRPPCHHKQSDCCSASSCCTCPWPPGSRAGCPHRGGSPELHPRAVCPRDRGHLHPDLTLGEDLGGVRRRQEPNKVRVHQASPRGCTEGACWVAWGSRAGLNRPVQLDAYHRQGRGAAAPLAPLLLLLLLLLPLLPCPCKQRGRSRDADDREVCIT